MSCGEQYFLKHEKGGLLDEAAFFMLAKQCFHLAFSSEKPVHKTAVAELSY